MNQAAKKSSGVMHCDFEEIANCNADVRMQFRAAGLDKKDFFGKSARALIRI
jgi:hypothetical protein